VTPRREAKDAAVYTRHTCGGPSFGRLTPGCPRCDELKAGAAPVRWSASRRRDDDARHAADVRSHNCQASGCGPVCTFGDW